MIDAARPVLQRLARTRGQLATALLPLVAALLLAPAAPAEVHRGHGIAMHGDLKYKPDFEHFDYVNPDAPKGGTVRLSAIGGYDTFNPFVIKGRPPAGVDLLFETLMVSSADEPFSEYGLLAETVETPEDRSWVAFTLNPNARWHDGRPVTVEDVIWSFESLKENGAPFYRFYYANVERATKTGERTVRFDFSGGINQELPLIVGQLPVLPKHYWEGRQFDSTTLEPPLGSGPYRIGTFEPNQHVVYERVEDHWAADHPTQKGMWNFARIRYDFYRDSTVAVEAFKAGAYDFRAENSAKAWATDYDFPATRSGQVLTKEFEHDRPAGMQGFVLNQRRGMFKDPRVRQALAHAFDFEWSNQALFYGQYTRTRSYFDNSVLEAEGLPSAAELEILEPLRGQVPAEVFSTEYQPPSTEGPGGLRANLRTGLGLLQEAGWTIDPKTRRLTNQAGEQMRFEILLVSPMFERIVLPFVQNLERLGISANARTVDTAQYKERVDAFDFDVVVTTWGQSLSPGNEQRDFWGSDAASRHGSRNLSGIADPAVDRLIDLVITAPDRDSLVVRVRALDRVLQWHHLVIPNWHIGYDRLAFWNRFGWPEQTPTRGAQFFTWWIDPSKDATIQRAQPR